MDVKTEWVEQLVAEHFGRGYLQSRVRGRAPSLSLIHSDNDDIIPSESSHRRTDLVEPTLTSTGELSPTPTYGYDSEKGTVKADKGEMSRMASEKMFVAIADL